MPKGIKGPRTPRRKAPPHKRDFADKYGDFVTTNIVGDGILKGAGLAIGGAATAYAMHKAKKVADKVPSWQNAGATTQERPKGFEQPLTHGPAKKK